MYEYKRRVSEWLIRIGPVAAEAIINSLYTYIQILTQLNVSNYTFTFLNTFLKIKDRALSERSIRVAGV